MWFREREVLTNNLVRLLETSFSTVNKLAEWMQIDGAIVRYALRNGGDADITFPNDDLRLLLAQQLAALLMAKENLMMLQRKKHLFNIRSIYVPTSPDGFEECVARVSAQMWPDCQYPRWNHLTSEQQYYCFGPNAGRFGPGEQG